MRDGERLSPLPPALATIAQGRGAQGTQGGWIRSVRWLAEVDSTNRYALAEAGSAQQLETPRLVAAERQTAGRGRLGRRWYADSGTLTFSLLLAEGDLGVARPRWPQLALVAGLAVAEAIEMFVAPVGAALKWPNDVYVDGGKLAGILVEAGGRVGCDHVVVGIGVNVSTDFGAAPTEVAERARSLAVVAGRPIDRWAVLPVILERLAEGVRQWSNEAGGLVERYRRRCYLTGREVQARQGERVLRGRCLGLADDGSLQLAIAEGAVHRLHSGEIEWFSPTRG